MTWYLWLTLAVVLIVAVSWPISAHNTLVSMQTTVAEAWRGIDIELTRRWELIPSLVEVAHSYAEREADLLKRLANRHRPVPLDHDPSVALRELDEHVVADETRSAAELSGAVDQLRAVAEAYPELQSSRHYSQLMTALRDTDDRIAAARRLYNGNVARYNAKLRSFPASVIGNRRGMTPGQYFELAEPTHAGVPPLRPRQS